MGGAHPREEEGWALVTALVLMLVMGVFAGATLTLSSAQSRTTAAGRSRETAFNLAEAALDAQTFALSQHWPGPGGASNVALRYPASCTATSSDSRCPNASSMTQLYTEADTVQGVSWNTEVRDDSGSVGSSQFWSESMLTSAPAYDANGDGQLWVRSQAIAAGHRRTLVALVHVEPQSETLPHATLIAGHLDISNMGNKTIIDTEGNSAGTGQVAVRCTPQPGEQEACLGHKLGSGSQDEQDQNSRLDRQISPNVSTVGYSGGPALTADAIERLRQTAISDGTYFTTCPPSLAGAVVFIDVSGDCPAYTGRTTFNSDTAPGVVVITSGSITLGGTTSYYGVIYDANQSSRSDDVVHVQGNANVVGGILVDGSGGVEAGSSKENVQFDDAAFSAVHTNGTAGVVQNTWREIRGA